MSNLPDTIFKKILDGYPEFYYREPDGNHYKYHKIVAEGFHDLLQQKTIIEKDCLVDRPVKIWKEQIIPNQFSVNYELHLEDLKQVQLYKDGATPELLEDSGILELGVNDYSGSYKGTSESIIPTEKYFVLVEDYNENIFYKGIPENMEAQGDKYDHDEALDRVGENLGIPRREFNNAELTEADYPDTYPSYCNDPSEDDYRYEQRIKEYMGELPDKPLPTMELKKYFGIEPVIEGRWRYVGRMNSAEQNKKFMRTANWNSAVFDVYADLTNIPKNIAVPSISIINSILTKTFPISKVAYFSFIDTSHNVQEALKLVDSFSYRLNRTFEILKLTSLFNVTANTTPGDNLKLKESVSLKSTMSEGLKLKDSVTGYQMNIATYNSANMGNGSCDGSEVSSDGLTLDSSLKSQSCNPYYAYDSAPGTLGWTSQQAIESEDDNYATCYGASSSPSLQLHGKEFPFNVPDGAKVLGVELRFLSDVNTYLVKSGSIGVITPEGTETFGISFSNDPHWPEKAVGGSNDLLGYDHLTGADLKALDMYIEDDDVPKTCDLYVKWFRVTAWWQNMNGAWTSPVQALPTGGAWYYVDGSVSAPAGVGDNPVLVDILDGSDNVLLADKKFPVDISGITASNIKVRVKLATLTGGVNPVVENLSIYSKGTETVVL